MGPGTRDPGRFSATSILKLGLRTSRPLLAIREVVNEALAALEKKLSARNSPSGKNIFDACMIKPERRQECGRCAEYLGLATPS